MTRSKTFGWHNALCLHLIATVFDKFASIIIIACVYVLIFTFFVFVVKLSKLNDFRIRHAF